MAHPQLGKCSGIKYPQRSHIIRIENVSPSICATSFAWCPGTITGIVRIERRIAV